MFWKARIFNDRAKMQEIMLETDPKKMKKMGEKVVGFNQKLWFPVSIQVLINCRVIKEWF